MLFNDKNVCLLKFFLCTMYMYFCRLISLTYNFCLLPSPYLGMQIYLWIGCKADSTVKAYYAGFMRWKRSLQMVLTCWIYSQEIRFMLRFIYLLQYKQVVSSVPLLQLSTAYTGRILLLGRTSLTESDSQKRVEGANRQLVTSIEKREPITPDMLLILHIIQFLTILCHSVLSILVYLPLQDFCVFPSYYMLKGAILFSNLVMRRFLFLKVKLTYFATEIQLSGADPGGVHPPPPLKLEKI